MNKHKINALLAIAVIEIDHFDTVTQNQMTLINWFHSMSVFNARFEHVINDNESAGNGRETNLR